MQEYALGVVFPLVGSNVAGHDGERQVELVSEGMGRRWGRTAHALTGQTISWTNLFVRLLEGEHLYAMRERAEGYVELPRRLGSVPPTGFQRFADDLCLVEL